MNHRHLPAGPALQGTVGPSSASSGEMPTGPSHGGGGGGAGGGRGRRGHPHFAHQQQYHHPQPMQHYANYMPPYPTQQYYPPVHPHPQYQNGVVHSPAYLPYQTPYGRSPPPMQQHYVPMVGVSVQQPYSRQSQNSPILSTPYQPPPVPALIPPLTPSSTTSAQPPPPPAAMTPPVPRAAEVTIPQEPQTAPQPTSPPPVAPRPRFRAPLPWLSNPDEPFPSRVPKKSRRRLKQPMASCNSVELPVEQHDGAAALAASSHSATIEANSGVKDKATSDRSAMPSVQTTEVAPATTDTKASPEPGADAGTADPSTPQPANPTPAPNTSTTPASATPTSAAKLPSRPAVPALPAVPKSGSKDSKTPTSEVGDGKPLEAGLELQTNGASVPQGENATQTDATIVSPENATSLAPAPAPTPQKPKSWASLLATPSHAPRGVIPSSASSVSSAPGGAAIAASPVQNGGSGMFPRNSDSLAEALRAYRVGGAGTICHIEPRGLTNGGNMCYMNSVLQVLLYCAPFYDFLDHVSKKAVHSFKSETPLIDAMIVFMREFRVLGSASSVEQLQAVIKGKDKSYGDPLTPNFLYDEMKRSKWFATLEQGHQQDAEEFLGWLLQALDDECSKVMDVGETTPAPGSSQGTGTAASSDKGDASDDWLEVGPRQKAVITRSSGSTSSSPISKIFGGLLRSEFRVPGLKPSITTEPYQPLQLDIGSPHVRNIIDALKGLTSQEKLHGDFNAQRGKNVEAFKQVLIDELPPVLILHLKRFQFDTAGGTLKIAKKIGYPLELDIPREVLSRQKIASLGGKLPKYKLFAVVYHHGKNASVGHYTVDVRRQDGSQWIRIDDTKIEPVRAEDVARGGSEEETPRDTRRDAGTNGGPSNRFGAMNDEDAGEDGGWKQVPSSASGGAKRWSNVVNGASPKPGAKNKPLQEVGNEKSVAYILFYQRV